MLGSGVGLLASSIAWAIVTGVPTPQQDPSPETVAYAEFHYRIIVVLMDSGLLIGGAAILWLPIAVLRHLFSGRRAADRND